MWQVWQVGPPTRRDTGVERGGPDREDRVTYHQQGVLYGVVRSVQSGRWSGGLMRMEVLFLEEAGPRP